MTDQIQVTPETLTFDHIKQWDGPTMKSHMAHPAMREAITNIVKSRSLEEVLDAQRHIDSPPAAVDEVPPAEAPPQVDPIVDTPPTVVPVVLDVPKKFVIDYQVKDEDGNPLGRPTHLEAASQEELIEKIREAHIQATRAFHRLKKQKVSFKEPVPAVPEVPVQSDAELLSAMKDLKSDDPQKQLDAVRKVQRFETDRVKAESDKKLAESEELRRQEKVTFRFLTRHKDDYNNNEANKNLIRDYFQENELAWTDDNLEICFHALESELAPVVAPVPPTLPVNPVVVSAPVVSVPPTTPAEPVVVQPQATVPAQAAAPANPVPTAPRPGVNGGIIPGQNSGSRPAVTAPKGLTAEEIKSWDGPTMRAKMRDPRIRPQIEAFFAARAQGKK